MSRKSKVLGLHDINAEKWHKLIYVHRNSRGGSCVNGEDAVLSIRAAGEEAGAGGFAIILPPGLCASDGDFLAVNSGETMLRVEENSLVRVVCPGFIGASNAVAAMRPISAGVLTVSDKGSRGEREDTAGPALKDLASAIGAVVEKTGILPDDRAEIAQKLIEWSDADELNLILTTGGTGLSARDVTPEAIMDVHDRISPGFGEVMRARAMMYTERGFLSRCLAATRKKTLIIAFPGSERAVRQCFEAIAPALRHGVETLCGWDSECGGH
ncbi:MAG: MogA/MoaB family molybdenum cofactor biosynthesis protein [Synergistaceae bacterium]|jgi:molybdenum cofactor synthesis domain-containing protein|nr:MogA/MoaB family molybdenum cofactor biosynthesis protein [Synergistaceae bacterium]